MEWIGAPLELTETSQPELFRTSHDFGFRDAKNKVWMAPAGTMTDGASIPRTLWIISGAPLQGPYRNGAVIHDAYYQMHGESRFRVDKMFYEAMLFGGTPGWKAWLMFKAVRLFGGVVWRLKRKEQGPPIV